ncbi:MAG: redox-regulated ATPase YchF [Firmicutes bacterium]|nr:redox-regulated ATPase YchF [Bacillota bacterium]
MKIGVVGLPNVGKSTLFNALTRAGAVAANYPFATIEPNVGIVPVPDVRVDWLTELYSAKSTIYATIEFVDIAGLVRGAASGEGLGNKFLANIRESDAIVHVVRAFENRDIIHVEGDIDPIRDIQTINLELILADLESIAKRIEKHEKQFKSQKMPAEAEMELNLLKRMQSALSNEKLACSVIENEREREMARGFFLLTTKPVIYCANVDESALANDNELVKKIRATVGENSVVKICAKIEEELSAIDDNAERAELMEMYNLKTCGLDQLIAASYKLLGLISYLTAGEREVRAWTITNGTKAPGAAGKIHTDFERGFIRAEIVAYDDLRELGSMVAARERGRVRSEGKDYIVRDGDVVLFRFNV